MVSWESIIAANPDVIGCQLDRNCWALDKAEGEDQIPQSDPPSASWRR